MLNCNRIHIITIHFSDLNSEITKILSIFFKLFHTFFTISIEFLHSFCWFLFDLSSTGIIEELFHKTLAKALRNRDCHHQVHPWQIDDSWSWSISELQDLFQSSSTSSSIICFSISDLGTHESNTAISKRLEFDLNNCCNHDMALIDWSS